jgi:hypothetical protein
VIDFNGAYMYLNQARSGGAFIFENECEVTIDASKFNENTAVTSGGIMSIIYSSSVIDETTITVKNCN